MLGRQRQRRARVRTASTRRRLAGVACWMPPSCRASPLISGTRSTSWHDEEQGKYEQLTEGSHGCHVDPTPDCLCLGLPLPPIDASQLLPSSTPVPVRYLLER
jgi:hypothetical protein